MRRGMIELRDVSWLILAFLASFLAFCNQSEEVKLLTTKVFGKSGASSISEIFLLLSIILSSYLGAIIVQKESCVKKLCCQNRFLMTNVKNEILNKIESYGLNDIELKLFVPRYSFLRKWCIKCFKSLILPRSFLFIKYIEEFTDENRFKNLSFRVKYPYQGIVGECYHSKSIKSVYDLSKELENPKYRFEFNHKQKLSMVKFCLCIPIFDKDNVIAIFQIDSPSTCSLAEDDKKQLSEDLYCFVQSLYESCPGLFID